MYLDSWHRGDMSKRLVPGQDYPKVNENGELAINAKVVEVTDPIAAQDAATKAYADLHIPKALLDAQTVLGAISDNTPIAIAIAEQRVVGRVTGGDVTALTAAQLVALLLTTGDVLEIQIDMDYSTIRAQGKPTDVHRGIFNGFSLPIYASDNEEIFLKVHIPHDWDETSDFTVKVYGYIDTANDTKNFNLKLQWENVTPGTDAYPATDNDVDMETATGASAAQYQSYEISFTVDYDIDGGGNELVRGDIMGLLLQRIAASANEIAGEFVVTDIKMQYTRNLLGGT